MNTPESELPALTYDPDTGAGYVALGKERLSARTVEVSEVGGDVTVLLDYNAAGSVIGIEFLR